MPHPLFMGIDVRPLKVKVLKYSMRIQASKRVHFPARQLVVVSARGPQQQLARKHKHRLSGMAVAVAVVRRWRMLVEKLRL